MRLYSIRTINIKGTIFDSHAFCPLLVNLKREKKYQIQLSKWMCCEILSPAEPLTFHSIDWFRYVLPLFSMCYYMLNVALAFHFVSFWEWTKKNEHRTLIEYLNHAIASTIGKIRLSNCRNVDVLFPWILFLALAYLISARCQHTNAFISQNSFIFLFLCKFKCFDLFFFLYWQENRCVTKGMENWYES